MSSPMMTSEMLINKYTAQLTPQSGIGSVGAAADYDSDSDNNALHGVHDKIRKNKDGKPRKRSQHSKVTFT